MVFTMAKTSAKAVADFLVHFSIEHGDPLTNLKLQKLLYYAQAWHLALYDEPLFEEKFEAWVHGPVVRTIYQAFKQYKYGPILDDPGDIHFPEEVKQHLLDIMDVFGHYSAWQLERMTHLEKPWLAARKNLAPDESSEEIISEDVMKEFYRSMMVEQPT